MHCKINDLPIFKELLLDEFNEPIELSSTISFFMVNDLNTDDTHNIQCDSENGYIVVQLTQEATANAGMFRCGFIIEYDDGSIITVPKRGNKWLHIGGK